MRGQELYGRYHQLIDEIAQSAEPGVDWMTELRVCIKRFDAASATFDPFTAQWLREELCAQLEHEALRSSRLLRRAVLFAAVKRLELNDDDPGSTVQE